MQAVDFFFSSLYYAILIRSFPFSPLSYSIVNTFRYDFFCCYCCYYCIYILTTESSACGATPDTTRRRYTYNIVMKETRVHIEEKTSISPTNHLLQSMINNFQV